MALITPGRRSSLAASLGVNLNANVNIGAGGVDLDLTLGNTDQSFSTISLPNTQIALYALAILDAQPPHNPVETFTFPLSPSAVSVEFTAMSNVYDVSGPAGSAGVQRIADIYGNSPIMIALDGTTGWQRHSTDGFAFTGMESIAAIQTLLNDFAALNRSQQDQNNPDLYLMEYYDYFSSTFWRVVPIGAQGIRQSATRPLLFDYSFRFAGLFPVDSAPPPEVFDPVLDALLLGGSQASAELSASLTLTLGGYGAFTAGAGGGF